MLKKINLIRRSKREGIEEKKAFVDELGGKCSSCGYKKNYSALCFHHRDPSLKRFPLDLRNCSNRSLKSLKKELKKTLLLCHNCHSELHNPDMLIV